jgi:RNA polymerase sigma-70 factor (ECF subfamily)
MKAVTVNVALRSCQKSNSKPDQVQWEDYHDNINIDTDLLESIDVEELKHFIKALPEGRRQVFNAFVIEGYSHKEIAKEMGISEGTSKSQLFDAKKELKQFIEKQIVILKNISL